MHALQVCGQQLLSATSDSERASLVDETLSHCVAGLVWESSLKASAKGQAANSYFGLLLQLYYWKAVCFQRLPCSLLAAHRSGLGHRSGVDHRLGLGLGLGVGSG